MARIDYIKSNYCIICELVYPKDKLRCAKCSQILRKNPRNSKAKTKFRAKINKVMMVE